MCAGSGTTSHDDSVHIVATADNRVGLQERWGLLGIPTTSGYYCFCIAGPDSDAHEPCPEQPPTGDMFDLMKSAGGFTVSLNDARAQLTKRGRGGDASELAELVTPDGPDAEPPDARDVSHRST